MNIKELRKLIKEEISKALNEETNSFKSIKDMNDYLVKGDYDSLDGYGMEEFSIINKHIKSDILDKDKKLTPKSLNSLIVKLEDKYNWY
jgi:hypothetical protein